MLTTTLGRSGPTIGVIGLGCMGMNSAYDPAGRNDDESVAVINRALDLGANLLDTADVYGPFVNETLVGRAIAGRREDVVLATKGGLVQMGDDVWTIEECGRPDHIRSAVDASLRRLGVDHIDLYQLHRVDDNVPLEETWSAMAEAVTAGKVRWLGLSEVSIEQIRLAAAIHPVTAVQTELSPWTTAYLPVVEYCERHGIAFLAYSPLGRGFLTGRINSPADLPEGDWRRRNPRFQESAMRTNLPIVTRVRAVADRLGVTPAQAALAWVRAQGRYVVPIPGTKRVSYLEENLAAAQLTLSAADLAELATLPEPVGQRY